MRLTRRERFGATDYWQTAMTDPAVGVTRGTDIPKEHSVPLTGADRQVHVRKIGLASLEPVVEINQDGSQPLVVLGGKCVEGRAVLLFRGVVQHAQGLALPDIGFADRRDPAQERLNGQGLAG